MIFVERGSVWVSRIPIIVPRTTNSGLIIEAETKGDDRKYRQLSGGEKTLIAQAIILALHMINHSPIHAIDEFTQKLDKKNKSLAFSMALATYKIAKENRSI
ncbi:unnamed protein product, partial [marine sediment metagenome]